MRKVKLYTAVSMNGMIARTDGEVDWLDKIPHETGEDYGYAAFYKTIDTTLMGNKTYQQVLSFGVDFPYVGKENFVFTRDQSLSKDENVVFVSGDVVEFTRKLKQEEGSDIWLIGGGQINTLLLNDSLIDEVHVHIMPIAIPDGIPLFPGKSIEQQFQVKNTKAYSSGVIECVYTIKK